MKYQLSAIILTGCMTLVACSSTDNANTTAKAKSKDKKVDLVCEYYRPTGSNLKKKVCMTRKQRDAMRSQTRDEMEKVQRHIMLGGVSQ